MTKYYAIAVVAVFITAFCQILLKLGAMHGKKRNSLVFSYLNIYTTSGYFLLFVVTLMNTYAYTHIELKIATILMPSTFVLVALLAFTMLNEKISKNQLVGSAIIIVGIIVFNI